MFAWGQFISKCLFGVFNSPKKRTKTILIKVQGLHNFRSFNFSNFQINVVYNSNLFSSPLVVLSNLDLRGFLLSAFILCVPTSRNAWTIVVNSNFFVHFLGELKIPKRNFKINWPLDHYIACCQSYMYIPSTINTWLTLWHTEWRLRFKLFYLKNYSQVLKLRVLSLLWLMPKTSIHLNLFEISN